LDISVFGSWIGNNYPSLGDSALREDIIEKFIKEKNMDTVSKLRFYYHEILEKELDEVRSKGDIPRLDTIIANELVKFANWLDITNEANEVKIICPADEFIWFIQSTAGNIDNYSVKPFVIDEKDGFNNHRAYVEITIQVRRK
jgi:hypothetical protein